MAYLSIIYSRNDITYSKILHKALKMHDLEIWIDWIIMTLVKILH